MGEPQNNPNNNLDFVEIQIKDYNLDLMLPVLDQPIAKVKGTLAPEEKGLNDIVYQSPVQKLLEPQNKFA